MNNHQNAMPPLPGRRGLLLGIASAALLLTGCATDDTLASQARAGDNKNYIAGDGSVSEYAPDSRAAAVETTGKLFDGTSVSSADWKGNVTVLNVWYAACAPCRKEAPDLEALYQEFKSDGVRFYGINVRDSADAARAFERAFDIPYPSVRAEDSGTAILAFRGVLTAAAVPSTVVVDADGGVAARVIGQVDASTLIGLVEDATTAD